MADLHSGKLHREFHHGPDPTPAPPAEIEVRNVIDKYSDQFTCAWVKVFKIISEFRIFRLTLLESQPKNAEFSRL